MVQSERSISVSITLGHKSADSMDLILSRLKTVILKTNDRGGFALYGRFSCIFMSCLFWEVRNFDFASAADHSILLPRFCIIIVNSRTWITYNRLYKIQKVTNMEADIIFLMS